MSEEKKEEGKKNPFGGFAFGQSKGGSAFGGGSAGSFSFSGPGSKGFGQSRFAASSSSGKTEEEDGGAQPAAASEEEEKNWRPDFVPLVDLGEKKEISLGEEDEDEKFLCRSKMYRFDKASAEWKERGVGDIKLLRHRETGKWRVVMRREKVGKLCANHLITPEMKLTKNVGAEKALVYNTLADFSDGAPTPETLLVRFQTEEKCAGFQEAFENAQKELGGEATAVSGSKSETTSGEGQGDSEKKAE